MNFGKFKFDEAQRAKESRRKATSGSIKEMKYRPKIGVGDFDTKTRQVSKFLGEGHKVKITIMFRGREMSHPELGKKLLDQVAEQVGPIAKIEAAPKLDGRNMIMVLAPDRRAAQSAAAGRTGGNRPAAPKGDQAAPAPDISDPATQSASPASDATAPATQSASPASDPTAPATQSASPVSDAPDAPQASPAPASSSPAGAAPSSPAPASPAPAPAVPASPVAATPSVPSNRPPATPPPNGRTPSAPAAPAAGTARAAGPAEETP
jgi:translation initiation factor IF-3